VLIGADLTNLARLGEPGALGAVDRIDTFVGFLLTGA
jgi:hypothetical protein